MFPTEGMEVLLHDTKVGVLDRDDDGGVRFVPDQVWLDGNQHPPLGLSFLQRPRPPVMRGLLPTWFENLLPEKNSPLRDWICRKHGIRPHDSPGLLSLVGGDLPGAVHVVGRLEDQRDRSDNIQGQEPGDLRFSLAGLQLKLSMSLSGSRFSLPARGESGHWIVKIPGERHRDLPAVEAATMSWARATGLEVPEFHMLGVEKLSGVDSQLLGEPETAFAIARFDRSNGRVHQEDFAQALDLMPTKKYGCDAGIGYDSLTLLVRDACGDDDANKFVERLAFVVASGNDDAHLKNWSFQWGHAHRPWLSPCYDLVASLTWAPQSQLGSCTLAASLGGVSKFSEIDGKCVERLAQRAKMPHANERFMSALERARETWPSVEESCPKAMRETVRLLWKVVPVLRDVGPLS